MNLSQLLVETGSSLTEADVLTNIRETLGQLRSNEKLTQHDVDYLLAHGGLGEQSEQFLHDGAAPERLKKNREDVALSSRLYTLGVTVSVAEAANMLALDRSAVYRSHHKGRLPGVTIAGEKRIARWAIHDGEMLDGLDAVPAAVWRDVHPLTLEDIMTSAQDDLDGKTPVEWLATGGNPERVAQLLEDHTRW